jgi:hypothetical protein
MHVGDCPWLAGAMTWYDGNSRMETKMSKMLAGSFVALITPFNKDGSVDFAAFRTLLKFQ